MLWPSNLINVIETGVKVKIQLSLSSCSVNIGLILIVSEDEPTLQSENVPIISLNVLQGQEKKFAHEFVHVCNNHA